MVALQKRLRKELKTVGVNQVGALTSKWLLDWLEIHDFNIPWYCAPYICNKLKKDEDHKFDNVDISLPAYYCDVKFWIPEVQFGIEAMPPCPNCHSNVVVVAGGGC